MKQGSKGNVETEKVAYKDFKILNWLKRKCGESAKVKT